MEGKVEGKRRQGRRRKDILERLKKNGRQLNLKEETLDRTVRRARFGRGCGPVARQRLRNAAVICGMEYRRQ